MQNRKKTVIVAAAIAGVLSVAAAASVAAQDYFSPLFGGGYVDHFVPGQSPCGYSPVKTITPSTYEDTLMLWYLCEDNRVIARRFFRTGGTADVPRPVYLVPAPGSEPTNSTPTPEPTATCPVGFVLAVGGGCVPPDHPLAAR